jgi:hypothetical protein
VLVLLVADSELVDWVDKLVNWFNLPVNKADKMVYRYHTVFFKQNFMSVFIFEKCP